MSRSVNKKRFKTIIGSCIISIFLAACSLPHEPGSMPKDIVDTGFEPMLNVFGVLRNDGEAGSSFFHVERFVTTGEMYSFDVDVLIRDAFVEVSKSGSDSSWVFLHSADSMYHGYYYHEEFIPEAGALYEMIIKADGFPDVTGSCRVPNRPQLNQVKMDSLNRKMEVNISEDSLAAEYRISLVFEDKVETFYREPEEHSALRVTWEESASPIFLQIAAADENLKSYRLASPSILPQSYHEDGSTVEGGLGVFGAVGISEF